MKPYHMIPSIALMSFFIFGSPQTAKSSSARKGTPSQRQNAIREKRTLRRHIRQAKEIIRRVDEANGLNEKIHARDVSMIHKSLSSILKTNRMPSLGRAKIEIPSFRPIKIERFYPPNAAGLFSRGRVVPVLDFIDFLDKTDNHVPIGTKRHYLFADHRGLRKNISFELDGEVVSGALDIVKWWKKNKSIIPNVKTSPLPR